MSGSPGWLYVVTHLAGALLTSLVYAAGFILTVRRWYAGVAARLTAIGFGLLLLNVVFAQSFALILWFLPAKTSGDVGARIIVLNAFSALMVAVGHLLLVLAVHHLLTDRSARNDGPPSEMR